MSSKANKKVYKKTIINNIKKEKKENCPPKFSDILSIPSNPEDIFTLLSPIGHGAFGSVYKAIHNTTKKIYAIKIIQYFKDEQNLISNISHIENINFCYKTVQEETSLMRLVNSSNYILKYYGSYFSRQTNTLWLILEYCASGSVIDLMLAMDRTYTEIEIATIIKMVLQGLIIMHSKNLIHRDIKGANILISEDGFAKIGDFGVGVKLKENLRKSKKGSPYWMSPQVVLNQEYGIGTDIWSLGITCLELINGEPPNSCLKPLEVMEKIGKCKVNFEELFGEKNNLSEDFKNFVQKCLVVEEKKRASAKELLKHNFIKKAKDNKLLSILYKNHINDLEDYRKEVEEYERELKMKNKKEREKQILIQHQKEIQNMSIECDSDENQNLNNIIKNINNKDNELSQNKSINSLSLNNIIIKDNDKNNDEKDIEDEEECEYESSLLNNNSIKYIDNIAGVPKSKVLSSTNGNIFDSNNANNIKDRYQNSTSMNKNNNHTTDIVNQSSNLYKHIILNNNSINIKEYTLESNFSNYMNNNKNNIDTNNSNSNRNIQNKNSNSNSRKSKIKCRKISFNKPRNSRQKNNNMYGGLNKTMDDKKDNSFIINQKLLLSYNNNKISKVKEKDTDKDKNINQLIKKKSANLINNIKSLSILSNKDIFMNVKNKIKSNNIEDNINALAEEKEYKYKPIITEDNIKEKNKNILFTNFINKHKQLKKRENKNNLLNNTADNTNTYDNSNSYYNTHNISNNLSFINNNSFICSNSYYEKKKNVSISKNTNVYNKKNLIINKEEKSNGNIILEIPINSKSIKSGELSDMDMNSNRNRSIEEIEIKNLKCNKREKSSSIYLNTKCNEEDINDSDDDGVINNVNNFNSKDNFKNINENKENINNNMINYINKKIINPTLTSNSIHSYSIIDSTEFFPSINKNNIFSNAHKKYFS